MVMTLEYSTPYRRLLLRLSLLLLWLSERRPVPRSTLLQLIVPVLHAAVPQAASSPRTPIHRQ